MQTEWACSKLQFSPQSSYYFYSGQVESLWALPTHESAECGTIKLHLNPKTNKCQAIKYADMTCKNPGGVIQGSEGIVTGQDTWP